jgi:hypothetical protein
LRTLATHLSLRRPDDLDPHARILHTSPELLARYGQPFADLAGTVDIFELAGVDLVEMVLATDDDWDRYAAANGAASPTGWTQTPAIQAPPPCAPSATSPGRATRPQRSQSL